MQAWNRGAGSGPGAVLEIVPFKSGEDPSQAPVSIVGAVHVLLQ